MCVCVCCVSCDIFVMMIRLIYSYLSPSEPDHVVGASFECALDREPTTCQTDLGDNYKINILHGFGDVSTENTISVEMKCIVDKDIFEPIVIEYTPYDNNENYYECIRIDMPKLNDKDKDPNRELWLRDYDINDKNMHSLRVEFEMKSMDIERGFDNVFLSWQYNDIYSHQYVSWTGTDINTQSKPGIDARPNLFWNVLTNDFLQICLNLKSDGDITGNGFKGQFIIRRELGIWSKWSECQTAKSRQAYRYGGQCGIGIRNKTKTCPTYKFPKPMKNGKYIDSQNVCIVNETSLNEFCTKRKCGTMNNSDSTIIPSEQIPKKLNAMDVEWRFNGAHRVDPQYPDPFRYILARNTKIDIDYMITCVYIIYYILYIMYYVKQ